MPPEILRRREVELVEQGKRGSHADLDHLCASGWTNIWPRANDWNAADMTNPDTIAAQRSGSAAILSAFPRQRLG